MPSRGADRLEAALNAGQLWRAKEILTGRLGGTRFSAATCEELGKILLRMGDDLEAGKFLFLSGVRNADYDLPIALYLRRHSKAGWRHLLASFPVSARTATWEDIPAEVRNELRAMGVPVGNRGTVWAKGRPPLSPPSPWGCLLTMLILVAIGLGIAFIVVLYVER